MAIDDLQKRHSALDFDTGSPPIAAGESVSTDDQVQLLGLYSGITPTAEVSSATAAPCEQRPNNFPALLAFPSQPTTTFEPDAGTGDVVATLIQSGTYFHTLATWTDASTSFAEPSSTVAGLRFDVTVNGSTPTFFTVTSEATLSFEVSAYAGDPTVLLVYATANDDEPAFSNSNAPPLRNQFQEGVGEVLVAAYNYTPGTLPETVSIPLDVSKLNAAINQYSGDWGGRITLHLHHLCTGLLTLTDDSAALSLDALLRELTGKSTHRVDEIISRVDRCPISGFIGFRQDWPIDGYRKTRVRARSWDPDEEDRRPVRGERPPKFEE